MLLRHVPFLKAVMLYSFTAFGGPQGHMGMMVRTFVQGRKDVTEEELLEYNAFCQMLPGPSSTQTIMLIAMKRGGVPLAILTLMLWVFPAALLMGAFSFLLIYFDFKNIQSNLFSYVQPMSVGFVAFAAARMMRNSIRHMATWSIMVGSLVVTAALRSPWVFPILMLLGGTISNFSNNRIPDQQVKPKRINWINLWLFAAIFLVAGIFSEVSRTHDWHHRRVFSLFENFFRFGSIVFGGGQALLPMVLFQYITRPIRMGELPILTSQQLLTGYGMVQAVPGPVFSICSFMGGMAMSQYGPVWQVLGCIIATTAVFLPSTLLLFFLFPIYENLKHHVIIYRALEGINAAVVGIIWASGFVLFQSIPFEWSNLVVVIITFCLLYFTKIPSPLIVLGWLLLGWTMN
ncbi:MAG: chromate efflux transporter [Taibaiella sp.]|nr:chromate efflux transporter [Taibaiella sp.]